MRVDGRLYNKYSYNKLLTIRISDDLQERINKAVAKKNMAVGEFIREAIENYISPKQKLKKE